MSITLRLHGTDTTLQALREITFHYILESSRNVKMVYHIVEKKVRGW